MGATKLHPDVDIEKRTTCIVVGLSLGIVASAENRAAILLARSASRKEQFSNCDPKAIE